MFKKSLIAAAAISMLFTFGACKKSADQNTNGDSNGQATQAAALVAGSNWNKADVNSLLSYVPADASAYQVSTRNFDIDSPQMAAVFKFTSQYYKNSIESIKQTAPDAADPERASFDAAIKSVESVLSLIDNYKTESVEWGLDPNMHIDSAAYLANNSLVAIVTLADGEKLKSKISNVFGSLKIVSDNLDIVKKEVGTGDDLWTIYALKDSIPETQITPAIAINITKNLVFAAVVDANVTEAELAAFKKPAANPITKDALGTIAANEASIAKVDNSKLIDLANAPAIKALFKAAQSEEIISEACLKESKENFSTFPGVRVSQTIEDDNSMSFKAVLLMNSKDELAKINALHAASPDLLKATSLLGFKLNFDTSKALSYFTDVSSRISSKQYSCNLYTEIANAMKDLPEMLADPQIRGYVDGITGINAALDAVDIKNAKFDGSVNITGTKIGEIIPGVKLLGASFVPELANLTKDQPLSIDLSAVAGMPLSINAAYTDNDLMVTTAPNDVMALTKLPKNNRRHFVELYMSSDLIDAVGASEVVSIMNGLKFNYTISIGSNEEGIVFDMNYKF